MAKAGMVDTKLKHPNKTSHCIQCGTLFDAQVWSIVIEDKHFYCGSCKGRFTNEGRN